MAKETDVNFDYIAHQRYIIEIKDNETGRVYFTERIGTLRRAVSCANEYDLASGLSARIFDTKTGEII